jgi:hypothetical protein
LTIGEERRQPGLFVGGHGFGQDAGHGVGQRACGGQRREETQDQQHTGKDLTARRHIGQDVGVLEPHPGQRCLETVEAGTAPQAERLLQPVPDEQRTDSETQEK